MAQFVTALRISPREYWDMTIAEREAIRKQLEQVSPAP